MMDAPITLSLTIAEVEAMWLCAWSVQDKRFPTSVETADVLVAALKRERHGR